ncbi:MAG: hypothetical protein M3Q73_02640 [bacterium]|nr:hypothetical protein [bacterium]
MKPYNKGSIQFIIILGLVTIFVAGFYVATKPPKQVVQPVVDATADWKTHSNSQYGFEFRYPPALSIDTSKEQELEVIVFISDPLHKVEKRGAEYVRDVFLVSPNPAGCDGFDAYLGNEPVGMIDWDTDMGAPLSSKTICFKNHSNLRIQTSAISTSSRAQFDMVIKSFRFTK